MSSKHALSRSAIASKLEDLSAFLQNSIQDAVNNDDATAASTLSYAQGVIDGLVDSI
jgi:hypothetical protein